MINNTSLGSYLKSGEEMMEKRMKCQQWFYLAVTTVTVVAFQNCGKPGFNMDIREGELSSLGDPSGNSKTRSVTLAWDPNSESSLAGYKIYYGNQPNSYLGSIDAGSPTPAAGKVTFKVTNLQKQQNYYFSVVAYDASKAESPRSNEIQVPAE